MRPIVDVAKNTLRAILRNKLLYVAFFLLVLLALLMAAPFAMMRLVADAGEQELARQMQGNIVVSTFGLWYAATLAMGMFLGATAVSSEAKTRTIVTVLAKPVDRWRFLVGKWAGIQTFLWLFLAIGMLLVAGLLPVFDVRPSGLFWLGVLGSFVMVTLVSGLALLLGTFTSPVFAGGATLVLGITGSVIVRAVDHPALWVRLPARLVYFLAPARAPGNMMMQGLQVDLLRPEYGLHAAVVVENVLYGLALLALGCIVFTVREVRLR